MPVYLGHVNNVSTMLEVPPKQERELSTLKGKDSGRFLTRKMLSGSLQRCQCILTAFPGT